MLDINVSKETLTIQKRVSLAKFEYVSIVERTLNIKQTSTSINLKEKFVELEIRLVGNFVLVKKYSEVG